jgi:hypothetical protein
MKGGAIVKKTGTFMTALGILLWAGYFISHILAAIVLFQKVKLWAFLIMLLVPGIGDFMAIYTLIILKIYLPLLVYVATCVVWIIVSLTTNKQLIKR